MDTKKKITMDDVPGNYAMCTRNDCEVCNHCLRYLAFEAVGKDLWRVCMANPLRVVPTAECEYFRTDELATYAKGFKKMQQEMLPRQYGEFSIKLIGKFGRTGYYERRRGERLCSPADIEIVRSVLREIGLPDLEFDSYLKQTNWCD